MEETFYSRKRFVFRSHIEEETFCGEMFCGREGFVAETLCGETVRGETFCKCSPQTAAKNYFALKHISDVN